MSKTKTAAKASNNSSEKRARAVEPVTLGSLVSDESEAAGLFDGSVLVMCKLVSSAARETHRINSPVRDAVLVGRALMAE